MPITLDRQLDKLDIAYERIPEGLPRKPFEKPLFPVLAIINGDHAMCLMAEDSILSLQALPENMKVIETYGQERMKSFCASIGLRKMTLMLTRFPLYIDEKLLSREKLVLPCGDDSNYLRVNTQAIIAAHGEHLHVTTFPTLAITPDASLDGSDFSRQRVRQAMNNITSIPPFPVTARGVIELNMRDDYDMMRLVNIIERDAPITSNLISWANSAASSLKGEVYSVKDAVNRLGTRQTMDYAVQASLMRSFKAPRDLTPLIQFASFNSLHSAYGAKLADGFSGGHHQLESYLVGLMHNLGELLMVQCFPERARDYLRTQEVNPHLSREVLSREVFKVSFSSSTDLLMDAWKMPHYIAKAARSLASYDDQGEDVRAADVRLWQVMMVDAGVMPYSHVPFGWDQLAAFPLGHDLLDGAQVKIKEFLNFSISVAQGSRI